ncbi:hypothetical protein JOQ06_006856 [Pogonophryne albipinna]|uniref:Uncharacterized protein n=1 Tax=Pogonophryne albipinna TaxID=1090488 RepID=A0AAD6AYW5_9TELE|nr:hypothetical protein JOQ06_006856 [Pogonophryne albipinna]
MFHYRRYEELQECSFLLNGLTALLLPRSMRTKCDDTTEPHVETQCASAPEVEDDPSQHAYPEIKFVSVGSSQSGFHGDAECVIYSVPRVEASSDEPLCTLLLTTPNNSHSLAEEAGVN